MKWLLVTESDGEVEYVVGPCSWQECEKHYIAGLSSIAMMPVDELVTHDYYVRIVPYV